MAHEFDLSWVRVLEHHASRTPDKPIAVFGDQTVTYREMADWSARLAAGLGERGVRFGDVVALLSYNSTEFLATIFAANSLGAIGMPINWRLAAPELRYLLEHSEARALVCDGELIELANRGHEGSGRLARACVSASGVDGWERFSSSTARPRQSRHRSEATTSIG